MHYHLHQSDYWYVPFGTARVVLHDLREGGPTDGATHCIDMSGENHLGVYIPPGVAHGFAALTDMVITYQEKEVGNKKPAKWRVFLFGCIPKAHGASRFLVERLNDPKEKKACNIHYLSNSSHSF